MGTGEVTLEAAVVTLVVIVVTLVTAVVTLVAAVEQGAGDGSRGHKREAGHPMTVLEQPSGYAGRGSLRTGTLCRRKTVVLSARGEDTQDSEGGNIS